MFGISAPMEREPSESRHGRLIILGMSLAAFVFCVSATLIGDYFAETSTVAPLAGNVAPTIQQVIVSAILTIPMLLFLVIERRSHRKWLRDLWELPLEFLGPLLRGASVFELAFIALLAGVGEELFFRGFLQTWLSGYGVLIGLLVPNILFGLLHWISPAYAACTFCIGLYFSCTLRFAGLVDLPTLMLAHSLYDLIALVCLVREVRARRPSPS